ncbi:immunity protein Imm33 domain-containing protein [Methylomonas sp. BW4-1]|uniref:immunity protein Imm33 domain-containing protein n=1 Tax=Methylomonas sp. BW4-1 TaxID=3376685 RepID=UPI0040424ADE
METASEAQIDVCRRFNSAVVPSSSALKLGIAIASLSQLPLNALRLPQENGTCGWYIWGGEVMSEAPDFFQPLHVSHVPNYVPNLLPYLALAPGWRVLLAPGYEDVWFDDAVLGAHS